MAIILLKKLFLCLILIAILPLCMSYHSSGPECIYKSPCLCTLGDNKKIDISHVTNNDSFVAAKHQNLVFYFHACYDIKFEESIYNITANKSDCGKTSLCVYDTTRNVLMNFGNSNDVKFTSSIEEPKTTDLIFTKGTGANTNTTVITLACTNLDHSYLYALTTVNDYRLILFSPHSCVVEEHHGLSTGSVLLLLFALTVGIYLIGGALVLHCLRGAQGKEMIPNLDFWMDLPNLIRDGIIFLLNGCRPASIPSAETYDRI